MSDDGLGGDARPSLAELAESDATIHPHSPRHHLDKRNHITHVYFAY